MKICMLTNTYRPHVGGVARSVQTLVDQCRAAGHSVQVIAPSFPGDEHEAELQVLRVPALQRFNGSDFSVRVPIPNMIARRIEQFAPDVIHTHHPFLLGDAALRIAYQHDLPLVFTHHTLYENYTHYVPFDSRTLKRFVVRLATDYANCCDAVIAPSQSVSALLEERGVRTPISVIPTGIDSAALASGDGPSFRAERGLPADAFVVGHVGRLAPEKNLEFLAEAIARWLRDDRQRRFLLVGDGAMSIPLRRRFERAGVEDRVLACGKLTGQTLSDAYAAMDLFAFASQTETQGMVLAEAMAAGLPVVALDGPGVRDVVGDRRNGRLLPAESDPTAFAEALARAEDSATRAEWHTAACATARDFDQVRCAAAVLELYRSVTLHERHPGDDWNWWQRLLGRVEAEWELISSKADSATGSLRDRTGR